MRVWLWQLLWFVLDFPELEGIYFNTPCGGEKETPVSHYLWSEMFEIECWRRNQQDVIRAVKEGGEAIAMEDKEIVDQPEAQVGSWRLLLARYVNPF